MGIPENLLTGWFLCSTSVKSILANSSLQRSPVIAYEASSVHAIFSMCFFDQMYVSVFRSPMRQEEARGKLGFHSIAMQTRATGHENAQILASLALPLIPIAT